MQLITVAGSPSVGKTSVILRVSEILGQQGLKVDVAKFDSLSTSDDSLYAQKGIPAGGYRMPGAGRHPDRTPDSGERPGTSVISLGSEPGENASRRSSRCQTPPALDAKTDA